MVYRQKNIKQRGLVSLLLRLKQTNVRLLKKKKIMNVILFFRYKIDHHLSIHFELDSVTDQNVFFSV